MFIEYLLPSTMLPLGSFSYKSITIVYEWEKRATNFILGIILYLRTVIQIHIINFCLGKRDTGSGPLYL